MPLRSLLAACDFHVVVPFVAFNRHMNMEEQLEWRRRLTDILNVAG